MFFFHLKAVKAVKTYSQFHVDYRLFLQLKQIIKWTNNHFKKVSHTISSPFPETIFLCIQSNPFIHRSLLIKQRRRLCVSRMANRTNQFFDIHDARRSELLPRQAYPNLINETCKLREPWSNTPTVPRCSFWMVSSSGSISQHAEQVSVSYLNGYWSFSVFEFWRLGLWRVSPRKSLFLKSLSFWSLSFSRGAIVTASIGYLFIYLPWKWSSCRSEAIQREKEPRFSFFSSPLLLSVSGNDHPWPHLCRHCVLLRLLITFCRCYRTICGLQCLLGTWGGPSLLLTGFAGVKLGSFRLAKFADWLPLPCAIRAYVVLFPGGWLYCMCKAVLFVSFFEGFLEYWELLVMFSRFLWKFFEFMSW